MENMHYAQDWLQRQASIAEIEAFRKESAPGEPSDWWIIQWEEKWQQFFSIMIEGDEIWEYRSPPETWQYMAGQAGYAVVRAGEVIHVLMTRMN
jgi:hypothetical protein